MTGHDDRQRYLDPAHPDFRWDDALALPCAHWFTKQGPADRHWTCCHCGLALLPAGQVVA